MSAPDDERAMRTAIAATGGAGRRECVRLVRELGSLTALDGAAGRRRARALRLPAALREAVEAGGLLDAGRALLEDAGRRGLEVVTDLDVPGLAPLGQLANPPAALWLRGAVPEGPRIAVVGSRDASRYGLRRARALGEEAARRGVHVVSGLARGVDAAAHRGALEGPGRTIAVLGSGLCRVYPPEHVDLADDIAVAGALISEFPPDAPPLAHHFPRRNRILAALCEALVVVEARRRSGALITARWAADLGREVFAVPGQTDNPLAEGALALLHDGAHLARDLADVLAVTGWETPSGAPDAATPERTSGESGGATSRAEARLLAVLDHEPMPLDEILARADVSAGEALTRLCALELRGRVEQTPGLGFRLPEGGGGAGSSRDPGPTP